MTKFEKPTNFTIKRLRNAIAGKDKSISRMVAIESLSVSDFPEKYEDLGLLLRNQDEDPRIRYAAATSLGSIDSREARNVLVRNMNIDDEQVLSGIVLGLQRYGDKHSLDAVLKIKKRTSGLVASQASFAAALISYRLGLKRNDLPKPKEGNYLKVGGDTMGIRISTPSAEEIGVCRDSIGVKPFGIEVVDNPSWKLSYGKNTGIVLLNRDFASLGAIGTLLKKKALLGLVAEKNIETGNYFVGYLILCSPDKSPSKIDIIIARSHGKLCFGGTARIVGNNIEFKLRSLSVAGVHPTIIDGLVKGNKLEIRTAQFSSEIPLRKYLTRKEG